MKTYRMRLVPKTAFGTPFLGETLFGCLCWALRRKSGNERLSQLLTGYTEGRPFAVVSDAFPTGFVPLPALPDVYWAASPDDDRKYLKKKTWVRTDALNTPVSLWRNCAMTDAEIARNLSDKCPDEGAGLIAKIIAVHNTINRQTLTTGTGPFAPYEQQQIWFNPALTLDVYVVIDEDRISLEEIVSALADVGTLGFGRDASVGLGKFELTGTPTEMRVREPSTSCMALSSVVLSGLTEIVSEKTFYRVKTHFGRHGSELVVRGQPFKKPILLAQSGAVITFKNLSSELFVGKGLDGLSTVLPETVHQGYAPVLSLPEEGNCHE